MTRGPETALRQDLNAVTENIQGWFMARDTNAGVVALRGKPIHNIALGWELGVMVEDELLERRRITERNNDYGSWKYRVKGSMGREAT